MSLDAKIGALRPRLFSSATETERCKARQEINDILQNERLWPIQVLALLRKIDDWCEWNPPRIYRNEIDGILSDPKMDETFLFFLTTLKPDDGVCFYVPDKAREILEGKWYSRQQINQRQRKKFPYRFSPLWILIYSME